MIELARQELIAARAALARGHHTVAAKDAIDSMEYALKYPLRLFNKTPRRDHETASSFSVDTVKELLTYVPFGDQSYELFCQIIFKQSLWASLRDKIRYGLENHPIAVATPEKLVSKELAELIVKDAQDVLDFVEILNSTYTRKISETQKQISKLENIEGLNPIDSQDFERIKQNLEKLEKSIAGQRLTQEEAAMIAQDLRNFIEKLEQEKTSLPAHKEMFAQTQKGLEDMIKILVLLGILGELFESE